MRSSLFSMVPWFLTSFVVGGMHITCALLLMKERHFSAWMMLAGSCISLMGGISSMALQFFQASSGNFKIEFIFAISAFTYLGSLLFAIGLLLHALRQRAKSNRIQELEAIIASLQQR